jgi:hypothetical protein
MAADQRCGSTRSTTSAADGNVATGAAKSIQRIFRLTHNIALNPGEQPMPPDRPLDDYELEVIRNWANLGNGETAIRGPGRANNHAPVLALTELARDATAITFAYELTDSDRDVVVGTVIGPRRKGDVVVPEDFDTTPKVGQSETSSAAPISRAAKPEES